MNLLKTKNNNVITYSVNKINDNGVYLTVQNGELIVNAPWYAKQTEIQNVIQEKREWILNKLNCYKKDLKKLEELKQIKILGIYYNLEIVYKNINKPVLDLESYTVKITIPNKLKNRKNEVIKIVINKMYNMLAEKEVELAMEKARKILEFAPEDYEIIELSDVLGKCEERKIIINRNIVKYKREIIEYVIFHEFCHLKYKKHTKSFYDLIKKYIPNYEKYAIEVNNYKY